MKRIEEVIQDEISECGLACIAMVCNYYGDNIGLANLRRHYSVGHEGMSFNDIHRVFFNLGLSSCSYQLDVSQLNELNLPAIIQWRNNHFVILSKIKNSHVEIYDPAAGKKTYNIKSIKDFFSGYAMEIYPSVDFKSNYSLNNKTQKKIIDHIKPIKNIVFFSFLLFLSLLVTQGFSVLTPWLLSLVVDEVISKKNWDLFLFIGLFFSLLFTLDLANRVYANESKLKISMLINKYISIKVINTLSRQRITFFERRNVQDLIKRISLSLNYGENFVSVKIQIFHHIFFSIIFFFILLYLDVDIAIAVASASLILILLRLSFINRVKSIRSNIIEQEISRDNIFLEYYTGLKSHKINQTEHIYQNNLLKINEKQITLKSNLNRFLGNGEIIFEYINNITTIIICYIFIIKIENEQLTIGALFTIFFYKQFLMANISSSIELILESKRLRPDWMKVEHLLNSQPEVLKKRSVLLNDNNIKYVALNDASLSYSNFSNPVFEHVNMKLEKGDIVGIIGVSGSGKTSIGKVISSLIKPTSGNLIVNGIEVNKFGVEEYRSKISAYFSDDTIFNGTVEFNIHQGENIDDNKLIEVLKSVDLLSEINDLPSGIYTLLGDGGCQLSTGQKQRLCLARAIYKKPQLLILDEPTANLNIELKNKILKTLENAALICVIISHDQSTIDCCNKVYKIEGSKVENVR